MSWTACPTEIRQEILEYLRDFKCRLYDEPDVRRQRREAKTASQSTYASVCREWNHFFEAANFHRLIINQDDIDTFGKLMVKGREQHPRAVDLRWIWLRLDLPTYDCTRCGEPESPKEVRASKQIFTRSLRRLFNILSRFDASHPGITFELSADSPSLVYHYAQEVDSISRDTAWKAADEEGLTDTVLEDQHHNWEDGFRGPISDDAAMRITGSPSGLGFTERQTPRTSELPNVSVIKAFMIRAQCYRYFAVREGLEHIIKACPELRDLTYETWKALNTAQLNRQLVRVRDWEYLISDVFKDCGSLRKVSLFEGASRCNLDADEANWTWGDPAPGLGTALAEKSRGLEELYVNNLVDGNEFFGEFRSEVPTPKYETMMQWSNLRRVSLFTQLLQRENFDDSIKAGGRAARNMPQLEFMELWYTGEDFQYVFTYHTAKHLHDKHKLGLRISWGGRLSRDTLAIWRESVSDRVGGMGLRLVRQERGFKALQGRDEFCSLVLKGDVLTTTTRQQIENRSFLKKSDFA